MATKPFLPATRLSPSSLSSQPGGADEQRGSGGDGQSSPLRHGRGIVPVQGAGSPSRRPSRGRHDRARDAVPRVALAGDRHHRLARRGAQRRGRLQPAGQRRRPARGTAPGPRSKPSSGRASAGTAPASVSATSPRPRVARHHGQRAAGGRLGGDHPERLGERARHDHRLGGGEQVGELGVVEPAGPHHPVERRRRTRPARVVEEGGEVGRAPARSRRASRARRRGRRAARSAASRSSPSRNAPKPTITSCASGTRAEHQRPGGEQQVDPLGGDQLADEDHQAVAPARSRAARGRRQPGRGRTTSRRAPPCHRRPRPPRGPAPASARPAPRRVRLARGELARCRRRAGRAASGASSSGSPIAAHRLSAVWREPTSTRARARQPLAGVREEAPGCGLTVYSSAEPWTLTA